MTHAKLTINISLETREMFDKLIQRKKRTHGEIVRQGTSLLNLVEEQAQPGPDHPGKDLAFRNRATGEIELITFL